MRAALFASLLAAFTVACAGTPVEAEPWIDQLASWGEGPVRGDFEIEARTIGQASEGSGSLAYLDARHFELEYDAISEVLTASHAMDMGVAVHGVADGTNLWLAVEGPDRDPPRLYELPLDRLDLLRELGGLGLGLEPGARLHPTHWLAPLWEEDDVSARAFDSTVEIRVELEDGLPEAMRNRSMPELEIDEVLVVLDRATGHPLRWDALRDGEWYLRTSWRDLDFRAEALAGHGWTRPPGGGRVIRLLEVREESESFSGFEP